jgi:hypothetical protein
MQSTPPSASDPETEALNAVVLAHRVAHARVERLMCTIYERGPRAMEALRRILDCDGVEGAIATLEDRASFMRSPEIAFGFENGARLGFGKSDRPDVRAAKAELPEALRDLDTLRNRQRDLAMALLGRSGRIVPVIDTAPERPRPTGRGRARE